MNPREKFMASLNTKPATSKFTPAITAVTSPVKKAPVLATQISPNANLLQPSFATAGSTKPISSLRQPVPLTPTAPVKTTAPVSSSVGATPAEGAVLSPAGQQFADRLSDIKNQALGIQQQIQAGVGETPIAEPKPKEESEYLKYLRSLFNPEEARRAQENVTALNKMQADEIARQRKETERIQKNEAGMLERGQQYLQTTLDRDSAKALADIAIAKGYSTDILKQFTDAGATAFEAEEAMRKEAESPLTLEEAKALQVPFGTTMAEARKMGIVPTGETTAAKTYVPGADPVADSWVTFVNSGGDMSKVPEEYRNVVVQGVKPTGPGTISPYQQERIARTLFSVDELEKRVSGFTTGFGSLLSFIPESEARDFRTDLNTLKSSIITGELTAMREASTTGGALGSITERELSILQDALAGLDAGQSQENMLKNLQKVRDSINRWQEASRQYGGTGTSTTGGNVTLPDGSIINTNW